MGVSKPIAYGVIAVIASVILSWIVSIAAEWALPRVSTPPPGVSGCCALL
jgi:hypothetical protein